MTQPTPPTDASRPWPPRFWWARRIALGFVALIVVVLIVRLGWGSIANRRLSARNDEIRAQGGPVTLAELQSPPIAEAENAATLLIRAAGAIDPKVMTPRESPQHFSSVPPFGATWHGQAEGSVQANARALELAHEARARRTADWGVTMITPAFSTLLPQLSPQRGLSNVIADAALHAHVTGNDALAIERIRDLLHQADMLDQQPPVLVTHLVTTAIRAMAAVQIQVIATELEVADDGADDGAADGVEDAVRTGGPATRRQVEDLIAVLLDESAQLAEARDAVAGERVGADDTVAWMAQGNWLIAPSFDLDRARMIAYHEQTRAAMAAPNHPQALPAMPNAAALKGQGFTFARFASDMLTPSYERYVGTGYASRFERRAAAVALAVRLYTLDHGAYPARLEDLVPQYLPSVPLDTLAPGARPLGYVILDEGRRPLVYSVGDNAIDDTILGATPAPVPQVGWQQNSQDQWRDLSRWRSPDDYWSRQAVDDDREEPAEPGDEDKADQADDQP